jgi:PAS domain S-box-containing protein
MFLLDKQDTFLYFFRDDHSFQGPELFQISCSELPQFLSSGSDLTRFCRRIENENPSQEGAAYGGAGRVSENAMEKSNKSFEVLVSNIPSIVYRVNLQENSRMEFFNDMLGPMTGYTADELTEGEVCSIDPLIVSEDRFHVLKAVKEAIAENKPFELEYRLRCKNGDIRHFLERGRPVYGGDGKPLFIDGMILDSTDRKSAEEALRASEEKFRQLAENIHGAFWIGSPDWNEIFYVSPGYEHLWGRSCESLYKEPRSWLEAVVEEDRGRVLEEIKRRSSGDLSDPDFTEYRIIRPDGSFRWVLARSFPVRDDRGEVYRIAGLAADITERKEAEETIRKSNRNLELRVQERTEKLAIANEELRQRSEQLFKVSIELTLAEQRERNRLAELIHDHLQQLLVGAKIQLELLSNAVAGDKREGAKRIYNLLCESIKVSRSFSVELSSPILRQHGLIAALEWLADWMKENYQFIVEMEVAPELYVDSEHLTVLLFQSVRELLFNVVKHAGVNAALLTMTQEDADLLRIVVSDQGAGFDLHAIGEASDQDDKFGLFTVRERLTLLGGHLEVSSAPGMGTTITMIVPLKRSESVY